MALITIKEYARRVGKTPDSVYQKIKYGSMKTAVKIGRDWLIDEDEPWADQRIKSGKYIDFKYGYQYRKARDARKAAEAAAAAGEQAQEAAEETE